MTVNDTIVKPNKNYTFPSEGNYSIFVLLDLSNCKNLSHMFNNLSNIMHFSFSPYLKHIK